MLLNSPQSLLLLPIFICFSSIKSETILDFSLNPVKTTKKPIQFFVLDEFQNQILKYIPSKFGGIFRGHVTVKNFTSLAVLRIDGSDFVQNFAAIQPTENQSTVSISTNQYKLKLSTHRECFKHIIEQASNGCECVKGNCACCLAIDIPEFQHSVCVNATYDPQSIGLELSIGVDNHYFTEEISVRNPPPICFSLPVPGVEPSLCVALSDLDIDEKHKILSGCIDFEIELVHLRMVHIKIGCFKMPI